jgi:hypothetical protein
MRANPGRGDVEHRDPERPQHAIVVATVGRSRGLTIDGEGHHRQSLCTPITSAR